MSNENLFEGISRWFLRCHFKQTMRGSPWQRASVFGFREKSEKYKEPEGSFYWTKTPEQPRIWTRSTNICILIPGYIFPLLSVQYLVSLGRKWIFHAIIRLKWIKLTLCVSYYSASFCDFFTSEPLPSLSSSVVVCSVALELNTYSVCLFAVDVAMRISPNVSFSSFRILEGMNFS